MAKSAEAFWWSLFSAGGMVVALLVPIHVVLTGIAVPLGWVSAEAFWTSDARFGLPSAHQALPVRPALFAFLPLFSPHPAYSV